MHQYVTQKLAIDMIEGRWKPDETLTLLDIQSRFSISRTVAREAAHTLQTAQAVTVKKRVGLIARPMDQWLSLDTQVIRWKLHSSHRLQQLRALIELRMAVEPMAAANTARQASIEVRSLMPVLASQMRQDGRSGDLTHFHELDIRFHSTILLNSGNELFAALSPLISTVLTGRVEQGLYPEHPRPEALDEHEKVARAIWKKDPEGAYRAMTHIVEEVRSSTEYA